MSKSIYEQLIDEGYPKENIIHHYSDLIVAVNPVTTRIVENMWPHQSTRELFVERFTDRITGMIMYNIAFAYGPYFIEKEKKHA